MSRKLALLGLAAALAAPTALFSVPTEAEAQTCHPFPDCVRFYQPPPQIKWPPPVCLSCPDPLRLHGLDRIRDPRILTNPGDLRIQTPQQILVR